MLLLPAFVSRRLAAARIGVFLHTPFPSSEIFRTLSMRSELLRGVLGADRIGFHLFEYARHFLTCCKRMLGLEFEFQAGGFLGVRDQKRNVMVRLPARWNVRARPQVRGERMHGLAPRTHVRACGGPELATGLGSLACRCK